jgi:hypothetical protein
MFSVLFLPSIQVAFLQGTVEPVLTETRHNRTLYLAKKLQSPDDLDSRWPILKVPALSGSFLQRKRKLVPCGNLHVINKFRCNYVLHLCTHGDEICKPFLELFLMKITLDYLGFIAFRKLSSYSQTINIIHVYYRTHAFITATTKLQYSE